MRNSQCFLFLQSLFLPEVRYIGRRCAFWPQQDARPDPGRERERERETRSIVGDKAKCGPCDSENWNVRTGAKPRHVSIRSQPGFPLNPAAFNRPTRLNFHRRWLRHLRLESVLNNYFYLPPTMTYRRGTRFPPPLLSCYSSKILSDKKPRHLERNARIKFFE